MKRIFAVFLALGVLFTCCCGTAFAVNDYDTRASYTLSGYSAELLAGSRKGEVFINYDVQGSKIADSIGVKSIVFYKSNGEYVTTVYGSESNGLIESNSGICVGDYYYYLTSGVYYYAVVTIFADAGNYSDSRTITTSTVKAP